jgi:NADPH-dependent 2,4-dienoyl-CoA reductase/sulfur reductase-like enzyme
MFERETIVIVGGVAGGASAAARARRSNEHARIIVYEMGAHVSFANCGLPYYLGGEIEEREKLLVATPALLRERFNIEVHVRHKVLEIDRVRRRCGW